MKSQTASKKKTQAAKEKPMALRTVNDLMQSVENEIALLKGGEISEPKARVIAKNREIQLKAFELVLNAAKLEARLRPELARRVGLLGLGETEKESKGTIPLQ